MISDFKYALRSLTKTPGFTIIAVITLALAIGANTTIFSLINDLFLRGPAVQGTVARCALCSRRQIAQSGRSSRVGYHAFNTIATAKRFLTVSPPKICLPSHLTGLGDPVQVFGGRVTSNYFDVLGVRPIRGRNFLPEEEEGADVALVTKSFWQKRLGGDPNVIGRSITLDGTAHTIVGVLPNMPALGSGRIRCRRGLDDKAVSASRILVRTR